MTFYISIHALREESDELLKLSIIFVSAFRSTLSARRATEPSLQNADQQNISIHALREESDGYRKVKKTVTPISIHALRGESDGCAFEDLARKIVISIHALRGESDGGRANVRSRSAGFQSTLSVGRATGAALQCSAWE